MSTINNLWEFPLRDFYDGVTTNRSGTLYENYQLYTDGGGQDTPALLELWRKYLVSLGIMIMTSVEDARQYWIDTLIGGGGVPEGFSLWKTGSQTWRFDAQRAISPART